MKYPSEWANRMKVGKRNKGPNPRARARGQIRDVWQEKTKVSDIEVPRMQIQTQ